MFDRESGKKLEGYRITLPIDYRQRIFDVSASRDLDEFADAIAHNIGMFKGPINAAHIAAVFSATISKMVEAHYPKSRIIIAIDLAPNYLDALIVNKQICQETMDFLRDSLDYIKINLQS
jgi:hypothetical protein